MVPAEVELAGREAEGRLVEAADRAASPATSAIRLTRTPEAPTAAKRTEQHDVVPVAVDGPPDKHARRLPALTLGCPFAAPGVYGENGPMTQQPFSRPGAIDLSGLQRSARHSPPRARHAPGAAGGSSYSVDVTQDNFQQMLQESMTAPVVLVFHSATQAPGSEAYAADVAAVVEGQEGRSCSGPRRHRRGSRDRAGDADPAGPAHAGRARRPSGDPADPRGALARGAHTAVHPAGPAAHRPGHLGPAPAPLAPRPPPARTRSRRSTRGMPRRRTRWGRATSTWPSPSTRARRRQPGRHRGRRRPGDGQGPAAHPGRRPARGPGRRRGTPDDVDAQTLVADLDLLGGHVEDAFNRLVALVARTSDADRTKARDHLLGLFAAVGQRRRAGARRAPQPGLGALLRLPSSTTGYSSRASRSSIARVWAFQ